MDIKHYTKEVQLADGRTISIETGKLARQAHGSVVLTMGNTKLLATVVSNEDAKDEIDFMPLSVDYQEKFASTGKIPGSFNRREGRLSDHEILTSRLVDRAIRPLFPSDYHAETQINIYLISADDTVMPDALAAFAASSALSVSDIPFNGPISEVRVIRKDGEFIVNPSQAQMEGCDIDMMIGASADHILMVEGEMLEVSEAEMTEAIRVAHEAIKPQCQLQKELREEMGLTYREYSHETHDEALEKEMFEQMYDKMYEVASSATADKKLRKENFKKIKEEFVEAKEATLAEGESLNGFLLNQYFGKIQKKAARNATLNTQKRLDGRVYDEIRPIWSEVGYLPSSHGSAVFTRGETQSLTSLTLGTKLDEQLIDTVMFSGTNSFMLHYNFPAFSTGEARPNRAPGRREIGHGNLAYRALKGVMPSKEVTPYTIRLVSDILESNGSSSMATVCAGTLALMDGGIPIKAPVAGIAMGLITDAETGNYAVLSDILGDEDHLGDMDFKVTGTAEGITACQMDIKVGGLSYEILEFALAQAKTGREHILGEMLKTIAEPRSEMQPHAPRNKSLVVPGESIGAIIGPGGKIIQEIQRESGATVVIEEKSDGGHVSIFATNEESMNKALQRIRNIVAVPNVGEVYDGIVKSVVPFGAFVEFLPGKEGLLHISEIKRERIEKMDGVLEIGEEIKIKLIGVDKRTGKYRLSRKALLPKK